MDSTHIAFKEWAVVVEALGTGEQLLILRKGGIHEHRGQFQPDHAQFWLFPTQFHEAETSVIPSKRPALRAIAAQAPAGAVDLQYLAVVTDVHHLTDRAQVRQLQGQHIWSEPVLQQRFEFGREPGLYALVVRVHALPAPVRRPLLERYGGCKSWIELESPLDAAAAQPVIAEMEFQRQRGMIAELVSAHALTHP